MMDEKAVLSRLGFKHNEEKNYFYKAIIPSGDSRGSRYVLYYRDGEFWRLTYLDWIYHSRFH